MLQLQGVGVIDLASVMTACNKNVLCFGNVTQNYSIVNQIMKLFFLIYVIK